MLLGLHEPNSLGEGLLVYTIHIAAQVHCQGWEPLALCPALSGNWKSRWGKVVKHQQGCDKKYELCIKAAASHQRFLRRNGKM